MCLETYGRVQGKGLMDGVKEAVCKANAMSVVSVVYLYKTLTRVFDLEICL